MEGVEMVEVAMVRCVDARELIKIMAKWNGIFISTTTRVPEAFLYVEGSLPDV